MLEEAQTAIHYHDCLLLAHRLQTGEGGKDSGRGVARVLAFFLFIWARAEK